MLSVYLLGATIQSLAFQPISRLGFVQIFSKSKENSIVVDAGVVISVIFICVGCTMPPEFNFFQHWYPLSPVEDLDPKRPTAVTVLGLALVIWKPSSSPTYRVFLDRCPHRLAPCRAITTIVGLSKAYLNQALFEQCLSPIYIDGKTRFADSDNRL